MKNSSPDPNIGSHKKQYMNEVAGYYSSKILSHGNVARGVDWKSATEQKARFEQLCKIINSPKPFSINDLGCGYGALCDFLSVRYKLFSYSGIDISSSMISAAKKRRMPSDRIQFTVSDKPSRLADYSIASGIFNVRLDCPEKQWQSDIESTLDKLDATSRLGFSFNCLDSQQAEKQDDLYYVDADQLYEYCKSHYSDDVSLLCDYGLNEFTILVRKKMKVSPL